eukprot:TRINITY_DN3184_c0_g2_i1.p2 TRINITY_DN3184_c0_g2~~TRINITY_DN3184_c0_g2_i1.p2  ORF type:complete len:308 (+),score=175.88 TRINITY_DN3184_c0_g2_i1:31-924(+)
MSQFFNKMKDLQSVPPSRMGRYAAIGGAIALLTYAAANSLFVVEAGHKAVIFNKFVGVKQKIYNDGVHFMIPYIEKAEKFSVRSTIHTLATDTPSKDLQMISISVRVLFHPQPENLPNMYRAIGADYEVRVLRSIVPEILKGIVAQFDASSLITQREMVSSLIKKRLGERAGLFWIDIDDVAITDLNFGSEYLEAVERKQVAQQEAERAKFIVEKARQTKQEIIVKAQGEARAANLINEMLRSDPNGNYLALKRIEAAKSIATAVTQSNNRIVLDSDNLLMNGLARSFLDESSNKKK